MSRFLCLLAYLLLCLSPAKGQTANTVTAGSALPEVEVSSYLSRQPYLITPASVTITGPGQAENQATETLLPALNALPGVRMEERSPGSYRLSLRGSLLRSPFGIRNVKIYLEEFPLTDAGGNTYLNLIDPRSLGQIEILKGPDGSLFGANSGGVLLLNTKTPATGKMLAAELSGGSFGLLHQHLSYAKTLNRLQLNLNQGYQRSDGYRSHSALSRFYTQASANWQHHPRHALKLLAFYSDLSYQTPGGLTWQQFIENPRQARPAAGPNPGAEEQQAGIFNRTVFTGLAHHSNLSTRLTFVAAVFGSATRYRNPFITNYETRAEQNAGLRGYLTLNSADSVFAKWKVTAGLEGQQSGQQIRNYNNLKGTQGGVQGADKLTAYQHFYFSRFAVTAGRLTAEAALSLNYYRYRFTSLPEAPES